MRMEEDEVMNILLVEDDKVQNNNLARIIEKTYLDIKVYQSFLIKDALNIAKEKRVDLFFIDINLPDGSGLDLAKQIREIPGHELTGIVFVTSEMFQVVEAFKNTHCYDFLVKPYNIEDIKKIIDVFNKKDNSPIKEEGKYSIINIDNNISTKIYHNDIIFVEYSARRCIIHTTKSVVECKSLTLSSLLKEIESETIVQSHKSYIVNTNYIEKIDKQYSKLWEISFVGINERAQLSVKYKDKVMESWNN